MQSRLNIDEHLRRLEEELLSQSTRKNARRVSELLAGNFREIGGSGRVYSKEDVLLALQDEEPISCSLENFEVRFLSEGVALATYRSLKEQLNSGPLIALRSSIWIQEGDEWRMVFHQGTRVS